MFWHSINKALSNKEREQFNEWHGQLYGLVDSLENQSLWVHLKREEDARAKKVREKTTELKKFICEIPWLFK